MPPPEGGRLLAEKVVVAWKDSREARRARSDALPFLVKAQQVVIAALTGSDGQEAATFEVEEVARGLSRHGVNAVGRVETAPDSGVASALDDIASAVGADLIVCGGYGHSRLNEWVFGGVTRDLLRAPRRFVLLSH
jgi:nucleotide-binding universal stress UspA family protein